MAKLVRFTRDHDHMCPSRATIAYKRGMELLVPDHIAEVLPADVYEPVQKKGRRRG